MPLPASLIARLQGQVEALDSVLEATPPEVLRRRSPAGRWSVHETVAHLARHQAVFLERLESILMEDGPPLPRYRAEDDPDWPEWAALSTEEVVRRLRAARRRLLERLQALDEAQLARTAVHPVLGEMALPRWLEFLALHEAHHLYVAMRRGRGAE